MDIVLFMNKVEIPWQTLRNTSPYRLFDFIMHRYRNTMYDIKYGLKLWVLRSNLFLKVANIFKKLFDFS